MKWLIVPLVVAGIGLTGYSYRYRPPAGVDPPAQPQTAPQEHPAGRPSDDFPAKTGTTWTYLITLGAAEPAKAEEVFWPMRQGEMVEQDRGRFGPAIRRTRDQLTLKLRSKSPLSRQAGLPFPRGVEMAVRQDDPGIFFDPDTPVDRLLFAGISPVPGSQGTPALHFVRHVDPSKPEDPAARGDRGSDLLNRRDEDLLRRSAISGCGRRSRDAH